MTMMVIEADKPFLQLQRQRRKGYREGLTKILRKENSENKKEEKQKREESWEITKDVKVIRVTHMLGHSGSEERNDGMNDISPDFLPKPKRQ